jgi:hypothetical protein
VWNAKVCGQYLFSEEGDEKLQKNICCGVVVLECARFSKNETLALASFLGHLLPKRLAGASV